MDYQACLFVRECLPDFIFESYAIMIDQKLSMAPTAVKSRGAWSGLSFHQD
jgi:hypothetical protein